MVREAVREKVPPKRILMLGVGGAILASATLLLSGCIYREKAVPVASPPTTVVVPAPATGPAQRVVNYPEGRYELRGDGTQEAPHYWVWIPKGTTPPPPPPPPRP
jgi:hypothetical protein